jgi:type IV pilus assembly protein PilW
MKARSYRSSHGMTIIELMVGITLGIFLVGGVISLFTSNQQSFRVNESLARLQESARFAYEQMNREIRDAGTNPCGVRAVNSVVRDASLTTPWWGDWNSGTIRGFDDAEPITSGGVSIGTSVNNRVTGTDAVLVMRTVSDEGQLRAITSHDPILGQFTLNASARLNKQDVLFACDSSSGAIFEIVTPNAPPATVVSYDATPPSSNCSLSLGWSNNVNCNANSVAKTFAPGSYITKFDPAIWYVGVGANGNRALFRETLHKASSPDVVTTERREYVPDVHDMQVEYLTRTKSTDPAVAPTLATSWVSASTINAQPGAWGSANLTEAIAVRVTLTFRSKESVGSDGTTVAPIERKSIAVISLRNREIVR